MTWSTTTFTDNRGLGVHPSNVDECFVLGDLQERMLSDLEG